LQSATYDNGQQVIYNYDAAGNRTTVTNNTGNNLSPVANPNSVLTIVNIPITFDPRVNDSSPQGYPLTVTGVGSASLGSTSYTSTSVTYTPGSTPGADSFTYTIGDGHGHSAWATNFVNLMASNPPIANNDSAQTAMGTAVKIYPLANDVAKQYPPISIYSLGTPVHGTAQNNGDGSVTYTPTGSYVGVDSFLYTITDTQSEHASATDTITIGSPPVAVADLVGTPSGTALTYDPRINDSDPNGLALSIVSTGTPSLGTIGINGGATLTYTPNAGPGLDTFNYTITNGGYTASALESVCVGIQTPIAANQTLNLNKTLPPGQQQMYVGGYVNPRTGATVSCNEAANSTITSVAQGAKGTTYVGNNELHWQSNQELGVGTYNNYDTFTFILVDPYGQPMAQATVTVNVTITSGG